MSLTVILFDLYHVIIVLLVGKLHVMMLQVIIKCLRIIGKIVCAVTKSGAELNGWVSWLLKIVVDWVLSNTIAVLEIDKDVLCLVVTVSGGWVYIGIQVWIGMVLFDNRFVLWLPASCWHISMAYINFFFFLLGPSNHYFFEKVVILLSIRTLTSHFTGFI